jgi:hypothetical protein
MAADTVVTLDDFEFANFEIPEKIRFGGQQILAVHRLVGGKKVIDAMGRSDEPLVWSGIFTGSTADDRARYLDGLRIAGKTHKVTWGEHSFDAVIQDFVAEYERFYHIPYTIKLEVISDLTSPITGVADQGMDEVITQDVADADDLTVQINDDPLTGLMGTFDSAISSVSSIAKATTAELNSVLSPLADVRQRIDVLLGSVGGVVRSVTTIGGVLPNNPIAQQAQNLLNQASNMTQYPALLDLKGITGRIQMNLTNGLVPDGILTKAGGNLFDMASSQLGDASKWDVLAKANGLLDPMLKGINDVKVPTLTPTGGGLISGCFDA